MLIERTCKICHIQRIQWSNSIQKTTNVTTFLQSHPSVGTWIVPIAVLRSIHYTIPAQLDLMTAADPGEGQGGHAPLALLKIVIKKMAAIRGAYVSCFVPPPL